MLILTASEVSRVFDMSAAFDAVEKACLAYSSGLTDTPVRGALRIPGMPAETLIMPSSDRRRLGLKLWYALEEPIGNIPRSSALITLLDPDLGEEIVLDGAVLTDLRTGAMTGIAARLIAPEGARTVAIIGSGIQARTQALALVHALPGLTRIVVHSRNSARLEDFASRLDAELAASHPGRTFVVAACDSAERACVGADVVVTATTSATPVLRDEWLGADVLVCGVGSHAVGEAEIPVETVARARNVVVDTVRGAVDGAGDILAAIEAGLLERSAVRELGELLVGSVRPPRGLSVFKSTGFGALDVFAARAASAAAVAAGFGLHVDIHA